MNPEIVLAITPEIRRTPHGWLAISEVGSPLCVGVCGATEEQARERFGLELAEWAALRRLPKVTDAPYVS